MTAPENFVKLLSGFIAEFVVTFPEYKQQIDEWWGYESATEEQHNKAFEFCLKVYPEKFFDILNKNSEIFASSGAAFLPGVDFSLFWNLPDVSENTREILWKYLQTILFSIVGASKESDFGDASKLFGTINNPEFKEKLESVMTSIQEKGIEGGPSPEDIHSHLSKFLDGKLGDFAKELANETAAELDIDFENATDINDVMQTLFKNPAKLMGLVNSVSGKLDSKIKSGELDQNEIMREATSFIDNMKNMPGLENFNIQEMLGKMGMKPNGAGAAPAPSQVVKAKNYKPKAPPKKLTTLKEIEDKRKELDAGLEKMMSDEELIALFKRPNKTK